jgi:fumarylacetoacetate (FAA) hydrolase
MKLATLRNGTRDGRLVVVSRDLSLCVDASTVAPTLQAALDDWTHCGPKLEDLSEQLVLGSVPTERFHEHDCESPLPRAYQWADGSAYINHVALVRRARKAELPASFYSDPLIYQGGSDGFLGPRDAIPLDDVTWGCDFEGELAVITDDVPMGVTASEAADCIRLVMLCNDVSLRNLIPDELAKGFGFYQSKPASAFSPVAVTPDELGEAWREGRLHRTLRVDLNGEPFGRVEAGVDSTFSLADLVSHCARTRKLCAGSIIGSGTVSNRDAGGGPGKPVALGGKGYSCIAELRTVETIETNSPHTPFLRHGDVVRIEMLDDAGHSIFGAIEQTVAPAPGKGAAS